MLKPSPVKLEGNDQYEGFAVDLIYELSLLGNFKYKLKEQKDGSNGEEKEYPNGTKIWDGMIGALLNYVRNYQMYNFDKHINKINP